MPRSIPRRGDRLRTDLVAIVALLVISGTLTIVVAASLETFARGDWPLFFLPNYSFLGERLRAGDLPGWNPHQFSGTPFIGDPESGWGYVPAMLLYTVLPGEPATVAFIGLHLAMAGVMTYFLARLLDLDQVSSFVAGGVFMLAWTFTAMSHMVIYVELAVWLVAALAGVELAARSTTWPGRLWAWLFAGIAMSQIVAAWLGQGAYYALVVICAWIVYRTLIAPAQPTPVAARAKRFLLTSSGTLGAGFALAAAASLPRVDAIARSNLAGGTYVPGSSAWADSKIGLSPDNLVRELLGGYTGELWWYVGAVAMALALMAPIIARRWRPLAFFMLLTLGSVALAIDQKTPLRSALHRFVPFFDRLHEHYPERILILVLPAVSLLAGATVAYLSLVNNSRFWVLGAASVPLLVAGVLAWPRQSPDLVSPDTIILIVGTTLVAMLLGLLRDPRARWSVLLALFILLLWDPAGRIVMRGFVNEAGLEHSLTSSLRQNANTFLYDNAAAAFLTGATRENAGRYAGYDPSFLIDAARAGDRSPEFGYRNGLATSRLHWLLVFNWASWFGLEDVQGYNPVQIRRYVEYLDALNHHGQEYHEADVFPPALSSPLLDLLNVRYLVIPAAVDQTRLGAVAGALPAVYADEHVRILERATAFPRAWLVHEVRQVQSSEARDLLASGDVDPHSVALLEAAPPPVEATARPGMETVAYVKAEPDRIEMKVVAQSSALLLVSEVWDPGWSATVDGVSATVYLADYLFRGVPVPAGEHSVVFSYEPPLLHIGLAISLLTLVTLVAAALWISKRERRTGS